MPPLRFHAGPDAARLVLSDLQAPDTGPVVWTRQPVVEATRRAISEQVAARQSAGLEFLVLISAELDPLARVLSALPAHLCSLPLRPEFVTDVVYWPEILRDQNDLPAPGAALTKSLWAGSLRAEFARLPEPTGRNADQSAVLPALAPRSQAAELVREAIARATLPAGPDGVAMRAGLFQLQDCLDDSHRCSQSIEGVGKHRNGDYWHAIMHRREPDYGNSKYWFRQVGSHPVFTDLARIARDLAPRSNFDRWFSRLWTARGWEPFAFVDLCEAAALSGDPHLTRFAERVQWAEMLLLLEQTARDAGLIG